MRAKLALAPKVFAYTALGRHRGVPGRALRVLPPASASRSRPTSWWSRPAAARRCCSRCSRARAKATRRSWSSRSTRTTWPSRRWPGSSSSRCGPAARTASTCRPLEDWRRALTPRTRLVLLCNPGNPTGTVYRRDELEAVAGFCREHGLFLVADEVYREFVYDGQDRHERPRAPGLRRDRHRGRQPLQALQRLRHPPRLPRDAEPRGLRGGAAHGAGPALAARARAARGARVGRAAAGLRAGHRARVPGAPRRAVRGPVAAAGRAACASPRAPSTSWRACRSRTPRTSPRGCSATSATRARP